MRNTSVSMRWIVVVLVALAVCVGLYKLKYPTYTYRYRITVEVESGAETRFASSVIEVSESRVPRLLPEMGPTDSSVRGQAVFMELPGGRNLVALLKSGAAGEISFPASIVPRAFKVNKIEDLPRLRGRRELTSDLRPTPITVSEPHDANSARVVDADALESSLGVRLRSISIEITNDPVTPIDIEQHLPFLDELRGQRHQITSPQVFIPTYSSFVRQ